MSCNPEGRVPAFARGVRLQRDRVREQWVIQAPERAFIVDDIAAAVLQRVSGDVTLAHIIDDLTTAYDAPREAIASDVLSMVADLVDRQALVWRS